MELKTGKLRIIRTYSVLPDSDVLTRLSRLRLQSLYPLLDAIAQLASLVNQVV